MFIPRSFSQTDQSAIVDLIKNHPLATIVTSANGVPVASHVPVIYVNDEKGERLITHVARANDMWQHTDMPWLIVFTGASHYISPNWYLSKAATHKEVPTYNYQAAHITAQPKIVDGVGAVEILAKTTGFFEEKLANQALDHQPWQLSDAPDDFIQTMCKALVAIEFDIVDIKAAFKLSQNKSDENRAGVVAGLQALDTHDARIMADLVMAVK